MPAYDLPSVRGDFEADLANVMNQYESSRVWDLSKLGWQPFTSPTQLAAIFNQAATEAAVNGGLILFPPGGRWIVDPLVVPSTGGNGQKRITLWGNGATVQLSPDYRGTGFSGTDTYQGRHWTIRIGTRNEAGSYFSVYYLNTTGRDGGTLTRFATNGMWIGSNNQTVVEKCQFDWHDGCGFQIIRPFNLRYDVRAYMSGTYTGNSPIQDDYSTMGTPIHALMFVGEFHDGTTSIYNGNDFQGRFEVERCPVGALFDQCVNINIDFAKLHGTPLIGTGDNTNGDYPPCINAVRFNRCSSVIGTLWVTQSYENGVPVLVEDNPDGSQSIPGITFNGTQGFDDSQVELHIHGMTNTRIGGNLGRSRALIEARQLNPLSLLKVTGDARRYLLGDPQTPDYSTDLCGVVLAKGVGEVDLSGLSVGVDGISETFTGFTPFIDERTGDIRGKVHARGHSLGFQEGLKSMEIEVVPPGTALTVGTGAQVRIPAEWHGKKIVKVEFVSGAAPTGNPLRLRLGKFRPNGLGDYATVWVTPFQQITMEPDVGQQRGVFLIEQDFPNTGPAVLQMLDELAVAVNGPLPSNASGADFTTVGLGGIYATVYVA